MKPFCIMPSLRPADPLVFVCEGCNGVLVVGPCETAPTCPGCGAKPCADCARMLAETRAKRGQA